MWQLDPNGTPLDDADAAREELRRRAWLAIGDGLRRGRDVRHRRVRLRDENGLVLFEGTLVEAVASDAGCFTIPALRREETAADVSKRLIQEIKASHQRAIRALDDISLTLSCLGSEINSTERTIAALKAQA